MKKIIMAVMMAMPLSILAQDNTWEQKQYDETSQKYLVGAVPEVDGRVQFSTTIQVEGKTPQQTYDIVKAALQKMIKEPNQLEQSRISLEDEDNHQIIASIQEWLVFKNKPLVLDRTRFLYNLIAECREGEVELKLTRIIYLYDEERDLTTYKAEEWITDTYGLTKKKNKLSRVSGKFRRKTIDRVDYIFNRFTQLLQK